jgi:hypothetical protein
MLKKNCVKVKIIQIANSCEYESKLQEFEHTWSDYISIELLKLHHKLSNKYHKILNIHYRNLNIHYKIIEYTSQFRLMNILYTILNIHAQCKVLNINNKILNMHSKMLNIQQNLFRNCYGIITRNWLCTSTIHLDTSMMSYQSTTIIFTIMSTWFMYIVKLIRYQVWCTRCAFRLIKSLQWYSGRKSWKSKKLWKL